jgi:undecaprenyl-diphosphatase
MPSLRDLDLAALLAIYGGNGGPWSRAMLAFTIFGGGWSALLLLPLMAWTRTRRFARAMAQAIVAQAIWVFALKAVVGRTRPWIALGYPPPFGTPHDPSFPSGHASGSFCVAAFLVVALPSTWPVAASAAGSASAGVEAATRRRRAWLVGAPAVALASLVALSRVYLAAHWPSDVVAGALMGSCFGAGFGGLYLARERARIDVRD